MRKVDEKERQRFIQSHPRLFDNTDVKIEMLKRRHDKLIKRIKLIEKTLWNY